MAQTETIVSWDDFSTVEIRVKTVLSAEVFKEARNPAYKIIVDFGDSGRSPIRKLM